MKSDSLAECNPDPEASDEEPNAVESGSECAQLLAESDPESSDEDASAADPRTGTGNEYHDPTCLQSGCKPLCDWYQTSPVRRCLRTVWRQVTHRWHDLWYPEDYILTKPLGAGLAPTALKRRKPESSSGSGSDSDFQTLPPIKPAKPNKPKGTPAAAKPAKPMLPKVVTAATKRGKDKVGPGPESLADAVSLEELVHSTSFAGDAAAMLLTLSNEFVTTVLTPQFAEAAHQAGIPFRRGKEAADRNQIRLIVDMSAMPKDLLRALNALAWLAYLEEWCIKHPTRDAVVQIMCSPETAAAVLLPETAVLAPKAAAAVLLLHADPGMRDCLQNGKRSEVLVNLDAGGSTQFVVGTTSALPNAASLFTSRTGHACKAPVDSLDNKWTTIRDPHTVCLYLEPVGKHKAPHLLRMSLRGYQILRQASSFDGRLLGGNCFYDGRPVVHTGNPDQADGVTVRAANGSMAQTCCSQDTSPCKMQVLLA